MTTRSFRLLGYIYDAPVSGTINLNGQTIYSGTFTETIDPDTDANILASGPLSTSFVSRSIVPVSISISQGQVDIMMFEWNESLIPDPADPTKYILDPAAYSYGQNTQDCLENRLNIQLNGSPVSIPGPNYTVMAQAGDTLTWNQVIFGAPA